MFTQSSLGNSQFWERNWSISKDLGYKIAISILVSDRGVKTDVKVLFVVKELFQTIYPGLAIIFIDFFLMQVMQVLPLDEHF